MEQKEVIEILYQDYYFNEKKKKCKIDKIEFDRQNYYIAYNINECKKFNTINTIAYPFLPNLTRISILADSISEDEAIKIFGISLNTIYDITALIVIRQLNFNDLFINNRYTSNDRFIMFGKNKPNIFYSISEIRLLNRDISVEKYEKYFKLFSIDVEKIINEEDIFKIINCNNEFCVLYLTEFINIIYSLCERLILNYYKEISLDKLNMFYKNRGTTFENSVKGILKKLYSNIYSNVKYISYDNKEMELDNLIIEENVLLNFECKSSHFNIYENENNDELIKSIRTSFGRGYLSIQKLYDTLKYNNGTLTLNLYNNKKMSINNKEIISYNVTLNPIKFASTSIHLLDEQSRNLIKTFPITINFVDFYSIVILSIFDKEIFMKYSRERFRTINEMGKFKVDYDEIDAFGFVLDNRENNAYDKLKELDISPNIEQEITINNCVYRNSCNQKINGFAFLLWADELLEDKVKYTFKKYWEKDLNTNK